MPNQFNPRLYARAYGIRGASVTSTSANSGSKQPPEPLCAPLCAECGLLECLCRPRFFAGQLLTEQDLNRLDAYIRGKNRLHTLQLNGYGVVNGLEVRCEPCGTGVVVGRGYAISPCGDDIVVCCDTPVDVCELVKKCQPVDNTCQPYQGAVARGCEDVIEDWVLSIRYAETPARSVAALRMGASCSCGSASNSCSCGKPGGSCGCGAGSYANGSLAAKNCGCSASTTSANPRGAPPECEPTVTCESYSFDVFPAPKPKTKPRGLQLTGPLWEQFMCCLQPLIDILPSMPGTPGPDSYNADPNAWNLWCCQTKQALVAYFSSGPEADCTIVQKLLQWSCPDPNSETFANAMANALVVLAGLLIEAVFACLCTALLPPAPCGTTEDRIPLAVVRVRKRDCFVISVCNWIPLRRTVLTFPTLEYWLSWIPWWASLGDIIHALCCNAIPRRGAAAADAGLATSATFAQAREAATLRANPTLSPDIAANNAIFGTLVANAFARGSAPLDPNAIVGSLFGLDLGSKPELSDEESANAPQFLLLNAVLRPIVTSLFSASSLQTIRGMAGGGTVPDEISAMKERIASLEETIQKMQH